METTADTTKIHDFHLRVVSNGYVVTLSNDPCCRGEEYVFDSLTALRDWISLKLPRFFSAEEKEQILKKKPFTYGQTPTS